MAIRLQEIASAIHELGLEGSEICIHSSMKSFGGDVEGGAEGILSAFLSCGATVMVPAFSDMYEAKPVQRYMPLQNGAGDYSFFLDRDYPCRNVFSRKSREITVEEMGVFARTVLLHESSVRGGNPLNSFSAVGPAAEHLTGAQSARDVYAPLRQLCADGGFVLLMGTGLESATIIHHAEQVAGRNPFVRWAYRAEGSVMPVSAGSCSEGSVMPVSAGSCSEGFGHFEELLRPYAKSVSVGKSRWTCYNASVLAEICSKAIARNPMITHCGDSMCDRCNDAVRGGPVLEESFWN